MKRSSFLYGSICGAIGFAVSWFRYGYKVLNPTEIDWLLGSWDTHIHFLGFHMFRFENWGWPLGWIKGFLAPVGTSIGLTDSIPLFAFLGKAFSHYLPEHFQYFGFWLFLSMCLQGIWGYALMGFVTKKEFCRVIGAIFFILSPTMLYRVSPASHIALSGHWLILSSLWIYLDNTSARVNFSTAIYRWVAWFAIAGLVHPYIVCMGFAIACVCFWQSYKSDFASTKIQFAIAFIAIISIFTLEWIVTGLFNIPTQDFSAIGFGYFSMNINTLVNAMQYSNFGPSFGLLTDGQNEGYNYLGLGVLTIVFFIVLSVLFSKSQRNILFAHLKKHQLMVYLCVALTMFSIGSYIGVGSILFFKLPISEYDSIFAPFRSSGRFFWPVNYLLVLSAFYYLFRFFSYKKATFFLTTALLIQVADLYNSPLLTKDTYAGTSYQSHLQNPNWQNAYRTFKHIVASPPFKRTLLYTDDYRAFLLSGAKNRVSVNMGFSARNSFSLYSEYRKELNEILRTGNLKSDTLYIIKHPCSYLGGQLNNMRCHQWDGYVVCYSNQTSFHVPDAKSLQAFCTKP